MGFFQSVTIIGTLIWSLNAWGSAIELCYFKAEVAKVTETHLMIKKLESVVSPGYNAEVEIRMVREESVHFPLPKVLRQLQKS